jgi:hypothetical protein
MQAVEHHRVDGRWQAVETEDWTMQDQATKAPLLVSARDAARMLAVSPRKLWAMTFEESPRLPHVRCGRLVRYSPDDLRRWIDARREGGSDDAR